VSYIYYLHHGNLICKSKRNRDESVNEKVAAAGFEPALLLVDARGNIREPGEIQ
jgi:hypothetical protein|tara:strand:- start:709 stop:870 length:162 start_codon:yes stop_codon:yes gene_type:complete